MSESVECFPTISAKQCTTIAMGFSWVQSLKRMLLAIFWIMTLTHHKTTAQIGGEWPYRVVAGARELSGNTFNLYMFTGLLVFKKLNAYVKVIVNLVAQLMSERYILQNSKLDILKGRGNKIHTYLVNELIDSFKN